eukprot:1161122-Pelagomonas_calceolata.AAC.3
MLCSGVQDGKGMEALECPRSYLLLSSGRQGADTTMAGGSYENLIGQQEDAHTAIQRHFWKQELLLLGRHPRGPGQAALHGHPSRWYYCGTRG